MKKLLTIGAAAALVTLGVSAKANAALVLSYVVCQGATCVTATDGGTGTFSSSVGDYTFQLGINTATNGTPTSNSNLITASATRSGNTSAASLDIWFTVQGYTLPVSPVGYTMDTALSSTQADQGNTPGRGLVSLQAWYSAADLTATAAGAPPAGSAPGFLASCTPAHQAPGSSDSCSNDPGALFVGPGSALYSLVSETRINIGLNDTAKYSTSGLVSVTAVPEPGSVLLLGTGLLGIGAAIRRRKAARS